jgi:O-antigen/teichoic acid export membrane protein
MAFSVRRGLAWMLLSQSGLFVLQFGGSVVIARLLTPHEMGVFAVAYAIVGILSTIRALGLSSFLIREPDLKPEIVATSFTINAILAATTAAGIAALSVAGGAWLGEPGVQRVLLLLAASPLLSILELVPIASLERIGAFQILAPINLAKAAVTTAVTILLAVLGFSYMSIAWGNLASAALGVVWANIAGRRFISLRVGLHDWRRVTRFGLRILMIGALGNIAGRLSDILIGRVIGLSALGLWSRAAGLNGLLYENIHSVIARIVFVDFSERHRRALPLRESYLKIVAMITALLWPAFAGLAVLAGPVIRTIYGPVWVEAAPVLSLLSVATLIAISLTMTGEIYVVSGETDRFFKNELKRTAIGLTLFTLGCLGGLVWAAAARIGDAMVAIFIYQPEVRRMTAAPASDFAPVFRQSAVLTAAAAAPAAILMSVNHWSEDTSFAAVLAAVALGVAVWATGLWLLRHPLWIEAGSAGRNLFHRHVRGA